MSDFDKMVDTFIAMLIDYKCKNITADHCVDMAKLMAEALKEYNLENKQEDTK